MAEALATVLRLRRDALNAARSALAETLTRQQAAERTLAVAEDAVAREMEAASQIGAGDAAVEAFAAWLPQARRRVRAAQDAMDRALAEAAQARAAVALARAALEAAETLDERRREEQARIHARREQDAIDDIARARPS